MTVHSILCQSQYFLNSGFKIIAIHEEFPRLHFEFSISLMTS